MFGYFTKVFGPISSPITETISIKRIPNWEMLEPYLQSNFDLRGNLLPSRKVAKPKGSVFNSGAEFTMNYLNAFMVLPSVSMSSLGDDQIEVIYSYERPWRWFQFYWMGFCTIFLGFSLLMLLLSISDVFFRPELAKEHFLTNCIGSIAFISVGSLLLWLGCWMRSTLMDKAKETVANFVKILGHKTTGNSLE